MGEEGEVIGSFALSTLGLILAMSSPPGQLRIATQAGIERIELRQDGRLGALVPLADLAAAIGGRVSISVPWVTWEGPSGKFSLLLGTPLVNDGGSIRTMPASSSMRGDTTWVPLAFVADILADPRRDLWTWAASSATLSKGPVVSPMVARPAGTPSTSDATVTLPGSLRPGHRVTLDPGHGGPDPGNPGLYFPRGVTEKHVNLAVSLLVRDELERRGVKVTMTRTTDTLINLGHRAPRYCRDDCDLFVSLHVNALDRKPGYTRARGFETYFMAEARTADAARVAAMENEAIRFEETEETEQLTGLDFIMKDLQTNEFLRESARAAELVQSSLATVHDGPNRGVKQAGFAVLNTAVRPAILIEMGFSTNPDDGRLMSTHDGQVALARAISEAIINYLREFEQRSGAGRESR